MIAVRHCWLGAVAVLLASIGPLGAQEHPVSPSAPRGDNPIAAQPKKVIEWGWDEPDTKFLREHIETMEKHPFDGLVFHVNSSKGGNFTWEMWGGRRFDQDEFQHAIDDLKATNFRRFTDRFLRVNVTPGKVDWFDEQAWSLVRRNFGLAAQIAKQGGCRGFMFDVEQYEGELFNYRKQPPRPFAEYQAKVRQRGREWMQEVNSRFAEITILLTFGYKLAQPPEGKTRADAPYGLLADFLDGMLEACSAETTLVDAWEFSYPYKQEEPFRQAYDTIARQGPEWTAAPEKYRRHVQAGFGLWMDYDWRGKGWNVEDFSQNHFTPEEFQQAAASALRYSDRYVWIYTEQPRWWTNEKLPPAYVTALEEARASVAPENGAADAGWTDPSPHASRRVYPLDDLQPQFFGPHFHPNRPPASFNTPVREFRGRREAKSDCFRAPEHIAPSGRQ